MDIFNKIIQLLDKYDDVVISHILNIVFAIVIFFVGRAIANFISHQLRKTLIKRNVEQTIVTFISSWLRYGIIVFTLVAMLGQLGVQTASIVAVIGAAGLAIGMALQGSLSNFAAGVLLIVFRPFKVGETVIIGNAKGVVDSIQIFSTGVITSTGEYITIPNNQVLSTTITNFTREPTRRIELIIGVEYQADIQKVYEVLKGASERTENVLVEKGIVVRFTELAASSINFTVLVWVDNDNYQTTRSELLEHIKVDLDANHIGIPYPTMDVTLNK